MTNIKLYIIGFLLLVIGGAIGWIAKPSAIHQESMGHDHGEMTPSSMESEEEIWTCSMHPQIRQNEFGICPICEMDLIPLDNSLSNGDPTILKMSDEAVKLAQVETITIGGPNNEGTDGKMIEVEGTVELDDRTINVQSSHVGGRIEEMKVNFEGQYISKGQKVASIYSTDLLQASQELLTAAKFENKVNGITEASIQKLKNWKLSDQQIQSILDTGRPIETMDIYAEQSGYVLTRKAKLGDYVNQGGPLYTIGNTSMVWLIFNVFESDMDKIRVGQKVTFTSPSIGNRKLTTRVNYIDPVLDNKTRTARVRAEIMNQKNILKPGMLITGEIEINGSSRNKDD